MKKSNARKSIFGLADALERSHDPEHVTSKFNVLKIHLQSVTFPPAARIPMSDLIATHLNELEWLIRRNFSVRYPASKQNSGSHIFKALLQILQQYAD